VRIEIVDGDVVIAPPGDLRVQSASPRSVLEAVFHTTAGKQEHAPNWMKLLSFLSSFIGGDDGIRTHDTRCQV
jgi:hypothetical protein